MFSFKNIDLYQQSLLNNEFTCLDAVNWYLQQISSHSNLNAFVEVFEEEALLKAKELDESRALNTPLKKLHGVVVAIKDVICYKDHMVTAASAILNGFTSLYTASALQFLIDEDAIIIGNCNCDEFAMGSTNEYSVYGPVLNAKDTSRVPGGSSGGSAVAVQAGMCMCSLGSDTGGSVRQPADYCGIIGFKPGYGSISRYGLLAYASSFDQIGIFAQNAADIRVLFDILKQYDPMDSTMRLPESNGENEKNISNLRYCLFTEVMNHPSLDEEIRTQVGSLADDLRIAGNTVSFQDFKLLDYIVPAYYVLTTAEASSNLSRYDGVRYGHRSVEKTDNLDSFYRNNRSEGFGIEVKRRIMLGTFVLSTGYYDAYFTKAQKIRRLLVDQVNEIFKEYDVILMPTVPAPAVKLGAQDADPVAGYLADIFTVFANLTGIPAISVPLFTHSNEMPFGVQLLAKTTDEDKLLSIAQMLLQHHKKTYSPEIA